VPAHGKSPGERESLPGGALTGKRLSAPAPGTTPRVSLARCVASLAALLTCTVGAGCGTGDDERRVRSVTDQFYAALRGRAGERACAQLAENTVNALESASGRSCAQAITALQLPGRRAAGSTVYLDSARADVAGAAQGEAAFLDRTARGWRISAAGCRPKGDGPYDCRLGG
jgi:hypothetical protein